MLRRWRTSILLFLAVLGPGFITANVDNDAGGILTYSQAGAQYGYQLVWRMLVIVNFTNVITEFSGIAGSLQLFKVSKYISVPLCALAVWAMVVKGNYKS